MKQGADESDDTLKLTAETIAVSFVESRTRESIPRTLHKSGESLFRKFVRQNAKANVESDVAKVFSRVKFGGFLQDPPTILLQGESTQLQRIRDAWSGCLLRAPSGYRIDFVGDVTRISARPMMQENVVSLEDAICSAIHKITSEGRVASQAAIANDLKACHLEFHSPHRHHLHETLGKLIRDRKVFCTGPGYHIVTTTTYSGKARREPRRKMLVNLDSRPRSYACASCSKKTPADFDDIHSHRFTESRNETYFDNPSDTVGSGRDGTPSDYHRTDPRKSPDKTKKARGLERSKSLGSEKRLSLVDRVADKLFRRRHKSSSDSETRTKLVASPDAIKPSNKRIKESKDRPSSMDHHCSHGPSRTGSERPVISPSRPCRKQQRDSSPHEIPLGVPDVIPEKHRKKRTLHSEDQLLKQPFVSGHISGKRKDVAVSCNLDMSDTEYESKNGSTLKYVVSTPDKIPDSHRCPRNTPKRTESLKLPKEMKMRVHASCTCQEPCPNKTRQHYASLRTRNRYPSLDASDPSMHRNGWEARARRSMSSVSSNTTSSYRHAYDFAPSIRIGSVIADHLEQLGKSRKYYSLQSPYLESLPSYEESLRRGNESGVENGSNPNAYDRQSIAVLDRDVYKGNTEQQDDPTDVDPEMKVAVTVAKRLAELDIKMTREEWKEYFTSQILPKPVEEVLQQNERDSRLLKRNDRPTYFEETSGSAETVIEARPRTGLSSNRSSISSRVNYTYHYSTENSETPNYFTSNTVADNHKENDLEYTRNWPTFHRDRPTLRSRDARELDHENLPVTQVRWNGDNSPNRCLTCERHHKLMSSCEYHSKICFHSDNASLSLTDDSGFNSPRDRSLSPWNRPARIPRGTFV